MDLPVIGSHCALSTCKDLDLLPIRCRCSKLYCRYHISPDAHNCSVDLVVQNPTGVSFQKLERCASQKCSKPSLQSFLGSALDEEGRTAATCPRCQKAFCASHRHPESHLCSTRELPCSSTNTAGQKLLAKHFASTSSNPPSSRARHITKAPSDPKKRALLHRVELMRMRHRAIPGDPKDKPSSVLVDQRLHIKVELDGPDFPRKEGIFWFRKNVGTGNAVDSLATHLGIPSSDSSPRQLLKLAHNPDERTPLRNDELLSSQVEEGSSLVLM